MCSLPLQKSLPTIPKRKAKKDRNSANSPACTAEERLRE